jgi:hypothetical protein
MVERSLSHPYYKSCIAIKVVFYFPGNLYLRCDRFSDLRPFLDPYFKGEFCPFLGPLKSAFARFQIGCMSHFKVADGQVSPTQGEACSCFGFLNACIPYFCASVSGHFPGDQFRGDPPKSLCFIYFSAI